MKLTEYIKRGKRSDFADKIGTTKGYLDLLCAGYRRPSPELAVKIEEVTNGHVTVLELILPENNE